MADDSLAIANDHSDTDNKPRASYSLSGSIDDTENLSAVTEELGEIRSQKVPTILAVLNRSGGDTVNNSVNMITKPGSVEYMELKRFEKSAGKNQGRRVVPKIRAKFHNEDEEPKLISEAEDGLDETTGESEFSEIKPYDDFVIEGSGDSGNSSKSIASPITIINTVDRTERTSTKSTPTKSKSPTRTSKMPNVRQVKPTVIASKPSIKIPTTSGSVAEGGVENTSKQSERNVKTMITSKPNLIGISAAPTTTTKKPTINVDVERGKVVEKPEKEPGKNMDKKNPTRVQETPEGDKQPTTVVIKDTEKGKTDVVVDSTIIEQVTKRTKIVGPDINTRPKPKTTKAPPSAYIVIKFDLMSHTFCRHVGIFKKAVAKSVDSRIRIKPDQVIVMNDCRSVVNRPKRNVITTVKFYIVDRSNEYSLTLTSVAFTTLGEYGFQDNVFYTTPLSIEFAQETRHSAADQTSRRFGSGIVVAIVIACIAGVALVILIILQIVMRHRQKDSSRLMRPIPPEFIPDGYCSSRVSIDSFRLSSLAHRISLGHVNLGLHTETTPEPSKPTKFIGLPNFRLDMEMLEDEFEKLYNVMPRSSEVPPGAENKNRFANVIPIEESRVMLKTVYGAVASEYINANYIKGYRRRPKVYIATQAPMKNTIGDLWRMVWEHQCRIIVMLTALDEDGMSRCEEYWPNTNGVDLVRSYGAFQITQKSREVYQEYIVSTLSVKDLESNLTREVIHFWYTAWPNQGVPESSLSIVKFILQLRPHMKRHSTSPTVIHCSPGTGRTGTVIAIDICMRSFEETNVVDILNCVNRLRQERGGAVKTLEQYAFIFKALNDYALMLSNPSVCSSATSSSVSININQ
ncbi:uncharacterized protein LOC141906180 isoform X2 [Tubulanus polymorphus]